MEQVMLVFLSIAPVYIIIAIGCILRKTDTLTSKSDGGMMKIAVHLLMPALILEKMIGSPQMSQPSEVFSAIAVGFVIIVICTSIAFIAAPLIGLKKGAGKRTFAVSSGLQNYGYLAIPLIDSLFPNDGAIAVLFVHNIGVEIALWTFSLMLLSGNYSLTAKVLLKGPIIAVIIGLIITFSGASPFIPIPVIATLKMLGSCALPIALLLIGTSLYDLWGKERINLPVCLGGSALRILLFPAIIIAFAYFLPISTPLKQVLAVQASLPAAMFPIILARHYQGQVGIAVQIVLSTTFISAISMPVILYIAMELLQF